MLTMRPTPFRHQPLPPGHFIRILHIDSTAGNDQLLATFKTIALSTSSEKYTAVSYHWGDATPAGQLSCSDGQSIALSETLCELLDAFSRREPSFTLWIDALCINQSDPVEKAYQVRLMGKVYSLADTVIIWLGGGSGHTQRAFQYIREYDPEDSSSEEGSQLDLVSSASNGALPAADESSSDSLARIKSMMVLLRREWFQRVWVIQEAILGANTWVACGDEIVDFDAFKAAILSIWNSEDAADFFHIQNRSYRGFRCATMLFSLQEVFQERGKVPLESLFEAVLYYAASDSRDLVFAIQGIADRVKLLPEPDYTASVEHIFVAAARGVLCSGPSLDLLALTGLGPRQQCLEMASFIGFVRTEPSIELPTWAPDFRQATYDEPIYICDKGNWDAGGPVGRMPVYADNCLHVDAMIMDRVSTLSPAEIGTVHRDYLKSCLGHALNLVDEVRSTNRDLPPDVLWKTLVMDMDMDENQAPSELRVAFQELLSQMDSEISWTEIKKNKFYRILRVRTDGWLPFSTAGGYFGVTYPAVAVGDRICLIPGCRMPMIVRFLDSFPGRRASLVGWCYIHNIMHGEALPTQLKTTRIGLE